MTSPSSQQKERSPLDRLIIFIVCLAMTGTVVAGVHYFTIDLPGEKSIQAPLNLGKSDDPCSVQEEQCRADCNGLIVPEMQACLRSCGEIAGICRGNPPGDDPYKPKFDGPQ